MYAADAKLHTLRANESKLAEIKDPNGKRTSSSCPLVLNDMNESGEEERFDGEMHSPGQDHLEFCKLILTIDPPEEDDLNDMNTSLTTLAALQTATGLSIQPSTDQQQLQSTPSPGFRTNRPLFPQSHKSLEEQNDSVDPTAGGASRLLLAQPAPVKRHKQATGLHVTDRTVRNRQLQPRRKGRSRLTAHDSSNGEDNESALESELSDLDY